MTFSWTQKSTFRRGAAAAVALVTATALAACGDDDSSDDAAATGVAAATDGLDASEGLELTGVLADYQEKAEELGYEDCMGAPDIAMDNAMSLHCFGTESTDLAQFQLFDREDVDSGEEVAEAKLQEVLDADPEGGVTRETIGGTYRPVDGDDVSGFCSDTMDGCDEVIGDLGLDIGLLEGALNDEELEQHTADEADRSAREYEKQLEEEEAQRQEELQNYEGWGSLEEATEQLDAWEIHCTEESAREGEVAWCNLDSMMVIFDKSLDDLEDEGAFDEVGRDEMVSVSDGDWQVLCTPGSLDECDIVADKTGQSVDEDA